MGCQMESQGAALKELQEKYAAKGVLLVGVDRIEHPYDVEDYLRHFDFKFPVFIDTCEESLPVISASLGGVVILDRERKRLQSGGKNEFEPVSVARVLQKALVSTSAPAARPCVLAVGSAATSAAAPVVPAEWSRPVRLGSGKYPRLVAGREGNLWCVWVTGDVPQQQLEYAAYSAGRWEKNRMVPAGEDAHAAAVSVSSEGKPVLVWAQKGSGAYRIYLGHFTGNDWQPPVAVSPAGNDAFRPDVYCLASGKALVAWYGWKRVDLVDYPNSWWRSIYICEVDGEKAGVPRELAELRRGSDDCWDPVITGDGENVQVSWLRDENPPKLWGSVKRGSDWLAPAGVVKGIGSNCRVQAASAIRSRDTRDGLVFEMFAPWGLRAPRAGTQIYITRREPNGWGDLVPVSSTSGRHIAPAAVRLADQSCLVFWCQVPGQGKPAAIRMRKITATAENNFGESLIATGEGSNRYPSAALDSAGAVWLAWQSEEGAAGEGVYVSMRRNEPH